MRSFRSSGLENTSNSETATNEPPKLYHILLLLLLFFVAVGLILLFVAAAADFAADAATADAAFATAEAVAAASEADLKYLQVAEIRSRDSATAHKCATNELHSPHHILTDFYSVGSSASHFSKEVIEPKV